MEPHLEIGQTETPAVLVDRERLLRNIEWAQQLVARHGLVLRPHVKTHKCVEIAQLQLAHGAVGVTASKVDEALVFIEANVPSITVAYPLVETRKLERLLRAAARRGTDVRVVVDSALGVELLRETAGRCGGAAGVFVEIDVGLHRCGLRENDPQLLPLVRSIFDRRGLRFAGLLSHAGHAYGASNAEEVAQIAAAECAIMQRVRLRIEQAGIDVPEVSVGSTPTVLASESYEGITEIRPGNYVFMDRTPVRLGLVGLERIALTVLATVVSRNESYLIIDAGSKVLSSDRGAHGTDAVAGCGLAFPIGPEDDLADGLNVVKLSEEHGFVEHGGHDLRIGTKLRLVPNHACPVVNLADELVIVSGDREVARWRVAARGKVR